jgi:hypothetical protein
VTSLRPNVVMVVLDTARASAFEPWGAPAGTTPAVLQLADRGTAVDQAVATCNWTLPSHAAMFTGRLPRSLGVLTMPGGTAAGYRPVVSANVDRILPEVLRRAGYETSAASANPWIAEGQGFATGFDTFVDIRGKRDPGLGKRDFRTRVTWALQNLAATVDDGAAAASAVVDEWLARPPRPPFFWFFNLMECHSPYLPPRPWNDLGPINRIKASREARRHLTIDGIWRGSAAGFDVPDDALERMRHLYSRSVSFMDAWLTRLLTSLDERGLLDDTIVVVTADHGENLGEGGLIGHAFSLDHRLLHVPLVFAGPDRVDVPDFISTRALPRIIGEAVGLAANPWSRDPDPLPDNIAVAQYDGMLGSTDWRVRDVLADMWGLDPEAQAVFTNAMTAATDGRQKLVRHGDQFRLYDLVTDPGEAAPVEVADATSLVGAAAELAKTIRRADAIDAAPEAIAALAASAGGEHDEGLEEQLRLLGYL